LIEPSEEPLQQPLHRSNCPPHCLSFPIDWSVLRRHDGKLLVGIQYRIRDKRNVHKRQKVLWIYRYGAELEHGKDKYFLCADCHVQKRYSSQLFAAESTTSVSDHLIGFHKVKPYVEKQQEDTSQGSKDLFQLVIPFNEDEYKQKLIDWTIKLRQSYREVTDDATIDLLTYGKLSLSRLLPTHHSTLSQWVKNLLSERLSLVITIV